MSGNISECHNWERCLMGRGQNVTKCQESFPKENVHRVRLSKPTLDHHSPLTMKSAE